MSTFAAIGYLILGLSILVTIHELGHYLPAKWFGMRVDKFYLFFDWPRKLFSFKVGETEYGVGLLPLGGYVKIAGIIDESMDKEHTTAEPQPWEFRSKPVWQRAVVMIGGVTMNVLLGCAIFIGLKLTYGEQKTPITEIHNGLYVEKGSLAEEFGFRTGDRLVSFKGEPIKYFDDVATPAVLMAEDAWFEVERPVLNGLGTAERYVRVKITLPADAINAFTARKSKSSVLLAPNLDNTILVVKPEGGNPTLPAYKAGLQDGDQIVQIDSVRILGFHHMREVLQARKGQEITLAYVRKNDTLNTRIALDSTGILGLLPGQKFKEDTLSYGVGAAIGAGIAEGFNTIGDNITGLKKVAKGEASARDNLAGPVAMVGFYGRAVSNGGLVGFLKLTAMLSMVLAFMNILPIPALDGGHLVFLLVEAVTGREPSLNVRIAAQYIGMFILLSLMLFIFFNDFSKLFA
jgi:regulator of sigma E protease